MIEISDRLGLAGRPVRLDLYEIEYLKVPAILHWDLNHFVVLKKATRNYWLVFDPAVGIRKYTPAEASAHFTGIALELAPTSTFEDESNEASDPATSSCERSSPVMSAMAHDTSAVPVPSDAKGESSHSLRCRLTSPLGNWRANIERRTGLIPRLDG